MAGVHRSALGATAECGACGLIVSAPSVATDPLYDVGYFRANYEPIEAAQRERARRHVAMVRRIAGAGPLLDYGCGTGVFLEAAAEGGYHPLVGVDVSAAALERAAARLGAAARLVTPGPDAAGGQAFAVISFVDSLAHVPDAGGLLGALVRGHLRGDGVVFVRTPVVSPRQRAAYRAIARVLPAGAGDRVYGVPKRYLLFGEGSLRRLLESAGLEIAHLETEEDYGRGLPGGLAPRSAVAIARRRG